MESERVLNKTKLAFSALTVGMWRHVTVTGVIETSAVNTDRRQFA